VAEASDSAVVRESLRDPTFADLVDAHFRAQRELQQEGARGRWSGRFALLRARFEEREGDVVREYWGVSLPLGLVLTEMPRSRWKRLLYRPPRMRLHRAILDSGSLPPTFHAALADGDMLAVRARFSLGDLSRHTVLARIFEAEAFLLELADAARGEVIADPENGGRFDPRMPESRGGLGAAGAY
jgi:hypothetical protein